MSATVNVRLNVNGVDHELEVEPRLLLVHALRDNLNLTGTHVGCDTSNCGACTIHLDGASVKSCTVLAVQADGAEITTIEGIGTEDDLHPMQEAFWTQPRPAVRLLHARDDHGRRGADRGESGPDRGRGPARAGGQPVSLHRLSQHRQGGARRRREVA